MAKAELWLRTTLRVPCTVYRFLHRFRPIFVISSEVHPANESVG